MDLRAELVWAGNEMVRRGLTIYTAGNPESNVFLQPSDPPSIYGQLAMLDADDIYTLVPMDPTSGSIETPVFFVNSKGQFSTYNWGTMKTMFRD